jgi:hypothetical protein
MGRKVQIMALFKIKTTTSDRGDIQQKNKFVFIFDKSKGSIEKLRERLGRYASSDESPYNNFDWMDAIRLTRRINKELK